MLLAVICYRDLRLFRGRKMNLSNVQGLDVWGSTLGKPAFRDLRRVLQSPGAYNRYLNDLKYLFK